VTPQPPRIPVSWRHASLKDKFQSPARVVVGIFYDTFTMQRVRFESYAQVFFFFSAVQVLINPAGVNRRNFNAFCCPRSTLFTLRIISLRKILDIELVIFLLFPMHLLQLLI